ncbi:Ankyrin-repeat protein [Orpheovirus IHUMI-LCC2]|uniref:Ankyrin-repeat protein n=1 Tax=Orpheovirus IHUMI-LCC2 TaxID=2023057 RepID=A0A2I2L6B9_9VIRU|nr:Ankyrin-repeat protein [Orpheovirus IHUMI-LCC2]SNW63056.1 Ankyrin-repeat protein [Orpheovirus IHUMI-LCC2]
MQDIFYYMVKNVLPEEGKTPFILLNKYYHDLIGRKINITSLIKDGNVKLLSYLYIRKPKKIHRYLNAERILTSNNLELRLWFYNNIHLFDTSPEYIMNMEIDNKNLDMLKYLYGIGYRFNEESFNIGAKTGNLEIMKWLLWNGCQCGVTTFSILVSEGNHENIMWFISNVMYSRNINILNVEVFNSAVTSRNINTVKWLYTLGCPWNEETFNIAIQYWNKEVILFLCNPLCNVDVKVDYDNMCPIDMDEIFKNIIIYGDKNILVYMKELFDVDNEYWSTIKSRIFDTMLFAKTALNGNLDMMKLLREWGCSWDSLTISWAIQNGKVENVKWLYENNIKFSYYDNGLIHAVEHGHLELAKWLYNNGHRETYSGGEVFIEALKSGDMNLIKWVINPLCIPGILFDREHGYCEAWWILQDNVKSGSTQIDKHIMKWVYDNIIEYLT